MDDAQQKRVEPASPYTAAWGNPEIVLRCGVSKPNALEPTSELVTVNGVDWLPEPTRGGYRFTTTGRVAYVEVVVPKHYSPEVNALVDLAGPIAQTVPLTPQE